MAKISSLLHATADAVGLPNSVVSLYARRLTDAGLLPKSTGRRYAQALPEHAAALLIALLSTDRAPDGPRNVKKYGDMREMAGWLRGQPRDRAHYRVLPFMTALIDGAARLDAEIWRALLHSRIRFEREPLPSVWYHFHITVVPESKRYEIMFISAESYHRKTIRGKKQYLTIEASLGGDSLCIIGACLANMEWHDAHMRSLYRSMGRARSVEVKRTLDNLLPQPRRPA